MKKLRFLKGSEFGEKEYMKHCDAEEIARILKQSKVKHVQHWCKFLETRVVQSVQTGIGNN